MWAEHNPNVKRVNFNLRNDAGQITNLSPCNRFSIDISTDYGKSVYASLLMAKATRTRVEVGADINAGCNAGTPWSDILITNLNIL